MFGEVGLVLVCAVVGMKSKVVGCVLRWCPFVCTLVLLAMMFVEELVVRVVWIGRFGIDVGGHLGEMGRRLSACKVGYTETSELNGAFCWLELTVSQDGRCSRVAVLCCSLRVPW